jgi:hypothetical protein
VNCKDKQILGAGGICVQNTVTFKLISKRLDENQDKLPQDMVQNRTFVTGAGEYDSIAGNCL